jgi:hypothetical protein
MPMHAAPGEMKAELQSTRAILRATSDQLGQLKERSALLSAICPALGFHQIYKNIVDARQVTFTF